MLSNFEPHSSINFIVFFIIPFFAPLQPACTAEIIFSLQSKKKIGAQSAVKIPSTILFDLVNKPSAVIF